MQRILLCVCFVKNLTESLYNCILHRVSVQSVKNGPGSSDLLVLYYCMLPENGSSKPSVIVHTLRDGEPYHIG